MRTLALAVAATAIAATSFFANPAAAITLNGSDGLRHAIEDCIVGRISASAARISAGASLGRTGVTDADPDSQEMGWAVQVAAQLAFSPGRRRAPIHITIERFHAHGCHAARNGRAASIATPKCQT
jgi:hypothetical protein